MDKQKREQSVGFQFGMFMRVFRKLVVKRFNEFDTGLTPDQFAILVKVQEEGEPTQTEISATMGLDKSAVLRVIDILESKHLIARINDAGDRRKKALVLTQKGSEKLQEAELLFEKLMTDVSQGINPDEVQEFLKTLGKMRTNAEQL
ncbi:MAG TPA: MarR family transcriptional regulator [Chitinophagales bacterium]|nr:MarR family transcriptional regulator [Chitinophagales bacterium]